jgi:hypothetical protein
MDLNILFIAHSRFNNIERNLMLLKNFKEIKKTVYIDGASDIKLKETQSKFLDKYQKIAHINMHKKNYGVRHFIPKAISETFIHSNNLLIIEDDILLSEDSIRFVIENQKYLEENIISLFNPITNLNSNILSKEGGIWGWCVSEKIWSKFSWSTDSVFQIFMSIKQHIGFLKSLYYTPLVYMSSRGLMKSWGYNWFYIRLKNNIKSLTPIMSLSQNVGIATSEASNTKRKHKHSEILISSKKSTKVVELDLSLSKISGYGVFEVCVRIIYNWFTLIKRSYSI